MSIRFKFEKPENVMPSDDVVTPEPVGTGHAIPEITPAAYDKCSQFRDPR